MAVLLGSERQVRMRRALCTPGQGLSTCAGAGHRAPHARPRREWPHRGVYRHTIGRRAMWGSVTLTSIPYGLVRALSWGACAGAWARTAR